MRKVFLDTETTGLAPGQIGQLSMIIEDENGQVTAKNYFFKIDYITQGAEEVCGRGVDFYLEASKGKVFADYADEIYNLLENSTIIAHNLKFDENFISTEFWRLNKIFKPADRFCTMEFFRDKLKLPGKYGKYKNPKLEELVDSYSVNKEKISKYTAKLFQNYDDIGFHDARYDVTSMYIAFNLYRESLNNDTSWKEVFCV